MRFLISLLCFGVPMGAEVKTFLYSFEPVRVEMVKKMTPEEKIILGEHDKYLETLSANGKIQFGGRTLSTDQPMGMIVIRAADLDEAKAVVANDPAVKGKVFRGQVRRFEVVFPEKK